MPNSRATRSAFSRRPLAIDTTRAPSHAAKAGSCVVRAKPVPMMPMPISLPFAISLSLRISVGVAGASRLFLCRVLFESVFDTEDTEGSQSAQS
jgi:hypothetical protein